MAMSAYPNPCNCSRLHLWSFVKGPGFAPWMPSALARHNQGSPGGRKALLKVACLHLLRALRPSSGHRARKSTFRDFIGRYFTIVQRKPDRSGPCQEYTVC